MARAATTPMVICKSKWLLVNMTMIWNKKQVIDPNCLFTEKLSDRPLNSREQMMKSQPSMQKRKNPQLNTEIRVSQNCWIQREMRASMLPSRNIRMPMFPEIFPPNLPPIMPLMQPPKEAPQPRAILQNPAQRLSLSAGVSSGIICVISEICIPQHSPSMTSMHKIDDILGQYLNMSLMLEGSAVQPVVIEWFICSYEGKGNVWLCRKGCQRSFGLLDPSISFMKKAQKKTESSPVVVMVMKQISTLKSPSPKVVINPAEICDKQYIRLNSPKHFALSLEVSPPCISQTK